METIEIIFAAAGLITGVYEVVVRFIPTVKDWTILGNIIKVLKLISDGLNRKK